MTEKRQAGSAPQWARDRCEACNRVIAQRPDARKRRCGDCVDMAALFPASVCRKSRRGNGSRPTNRGGR